jgi:hypothetical protein
VLVPFTTPGVSLLNLRGLDGDDTFNIDGNHPFGGGIFIDGGEPTASDLVSFFTPANAATTLNYETSTVSMAGFAGVRF